MPQIPADKNYFSFAGGLNTDASKINFPDETTHDENDFELLRDGSRKRRRGLDLESGGSQYTLPATLGVSDAVTSYTWKDAGGTGDNFLVVQNGCWLTFFEATITPSSTASPVEYNLCVHKVSGKADSDVSQNPVSMTDGRNKLFVCGRYLEPVYIDWDGSNFSVKPITIEIRDYVGVDDGVNDVTKPTTLTNEHKYNLVNRGWRLDNITQFFNDKSYYPAKNMFPWKGFRRSVTASYAELDGEWEFNSNKMDAELFGGTSAVQGHLIINPFNTTRTGESANVKFIEAVDTSNWIYTNQGTLQDIPLTITGHGFTPLSGTVDITISSLVITWEPFRGISVDTPLDGDYTATITDANTLTIQYTLPSIIESNPVTAAFAVSLGYVHEDTGATEVLTHPDPFVTSERPTQCMWYAGRIFFFGIQEPTLNDRVFFSRVVEKNKHHGNCFQDADPTDDYYNELVATDGGYIVLPDLGEVKGRALYGASMLIFTTRGVWQISGASNSYFSAISYQVNKVSDLPCTSLYGIVSGGETVYWTGTQGIHRIFRDPQTGFLTSDTITITRLQKLWNEIKETEQSNIKLAYDISQQRLYILYKSLNTYNYNQYDTVLVYDALLNAFFKYTFPTAAANYITHLTGIITNESGENNKNIKFFVQKSTRTVLDICDMAQSDFVDFDGSQKIPQLLTGYDNIGDFARRKQAPVLHLYANKTETGYTLVGTDLVPINESSILITPVWDWSDNSNSKKFGTEQEAYRHRRYYQPVDASDEFDNGYPVLVSRTKLRGMGKVLHLQIKGATDKDAHILGWSIMYKANRGK